MKISNTHIFARVLSIVILVKLSLVYVKVKIR
jgi:hypothetical protein